MNPTTDKTILESIEYICNKLQDRDAVLFLGAGINYGLKNDSGVYFPLGPGLAQMISADLLDAPDLKGNLDDISEYAMERVGRESVNKYIFDMMESFEPSPSHLTLVQLPWHVIYTTNYDKLVERAVVAPGLVPAGKICPIFSTKNIELGDFTEDDILYFKIHGCIDEASTNEGRLILTKDDYRYYEKHRRKLFSRLEKDLSRKTFVFIGYSMADSNLRAILDDCKLELDIKALPLSFSVRPGFTEIEESFYRQKYNIQHVRATGEEFLKQLHDTWKASNRSVVPFEQRRSKEYHIGDDGTDFEKIADSYFRILPQNCSGQSNPKNFFRGAAATWADIRDGIAPHRDQYWHVFETIWGELTTQDAQPSAYLITGHAGTGKSALIRSLAFDIAKDNSIAVLQHISGTPFNTGVLATLLSDKSIHRIILLIDHAGESAKKLVAFEDELKQRKLPVTLLLEERKNQWLTSTMSINSNS